MTEAADALKGLYFPVLDHGFVALVDYMGGDADIVQAARTSYGAGTKKPSEDRALVRYLLRHRHTTPFEMVELKFHVRLPIFVARQLIRHRTANVNEYSLRYSLPVMQFYMPTDEDMGTQNKKNRQGRAEPVGLYQAKDIKRRWRALQEESVELYELCIRKDVDLARELARLHLPLSIYTEWYWKIDLHNLLGFLKLRVDKHAQKEIQDVSRLKAQICNIVAPNATEAWVDYAFMAKTFSRMEMQVLRQLLQSGGGELGGRGGVAYTKDGLLYAGLGTREVDELLALFDQSGGDSFEAPDLTLDLTKAKTASYFEEEGKKYLPKEE